MSQEILKTVQSKYGAVAASSLSNAHAGVSAVAQAFGYSAEELASIPANANMGLSCGNPIALASLRPGEVVVDLGSGGGLDVFLASPKVGPAGKAIGIDMTPAMIERAQKNAQQGPDGKPYTNVEFHLATIDKLPLADASVDVVISNCVINLAPDKAAVFREIARVLKPGGRLAVSDIALKKPLPPGIAQDVTAYVGCIAGAILITDYEKGLKDAGFSAVQIIDSGADLNAYKQVASESGCCSPAPASALAQSSCCGGDSASDQKRMPGGESSCCSPAPSSAPAQSSCCGGDSASDQKRIESTKSSCCSPAPSKGFVHEGLSRLLASYDVNDFAASVKVFAVKP